MADKTTEQMAMEALQRIGEHERLCEFRYKQIVEHQERAEKDRRDLSDLVAKSTKEIYDMVHSISRSLIYGLLTIVVGGLGWALIHLLDK